MLQKLSTLTTTIILTLSLLPTPTSALTAPDCDFLTDQICDYAYTGNVQTFTVSLTGDYQIELWGASGGQGKVNNGFNANVGLGAYTSGTIHLTAGQTFNIYVAGQGANTTYGNNQPKAAGGYNGGGSGGRDTLDNEGGGGGGGATDIRLDTTLHSRIMVAAGGGGTSGCAAGYPAGALTSVATAGAASATQTSGASFGTGGTGNDSANYCRGGGGGGGYWGGYADTRSRVDQTGGTGGSSFISGHLGAVAIESASSTTPRYDSTATTRCANNTTDITCSHHYSGLIFENTQMLSGAQSMPSPNDTTTTGNTGNGYARITLVSSYISLSVSPQNINIPVSPQDIVTTTPATTTQTITTRTNYPAGYTLKLSMQSTEQRLSHPHPTLGTIYINPTSPYDYPHLSINSWGYSLDTTTFKPVPPSSNPDIIHQTSSATTHQTTVTYGAKVNLSQPAGTYTGTITYTLTAN
jgi:hypothetical protein